MSKVAKITTKKKTQSNAAEIEWKGLLLKTQFEVVEPKKAYEYLSRLEKKSQSVKYQRGVDQGTVAKYARLMSEDKWLINGDTICLDKNNYLINGQHRLKSIIKSNRPQLCIIVSGLDPDAIETIDQGKPRTASDLLVMAGYKRAEAGLLSVMAKNEILITRYKNPYLSSKAKNPTPQEIRDEAERNESLMGSALWIMDFAKKSPPVDSAQIGFLHYRFRQFVELHIVDDWFRELVTGEFLKSDDPRYWIRERCETEKKTLQTTRFQMKCAWIIRAFDRHYKNKELPSKQNFFVSTEVDQEVGNLFE